MALTPSTLRPGLLVSLRTHIAGNVSYRRQDLEPDHVTVEGHAQARWETERRIEDPAEHARAVKVRSDVRALIERVCAVSTFGLLCPESKTADLDAAIAEGRQTIDAFNADSRCSKLALYVLVGRIAPDDVEAVKAINSEVATLMATMAQGLEALDVRVVREAASKARGLETMLAAPAASRIKTAIATARTAARQIVKAGEQGAAAIDQEAIAKIAACRTAFLDFEDEQDTAPVAVPGTPLRMLDLDVLPELDAPEPLGPAIAARLATQVIALAQQGESALCSALADGSLDVILESEETYAV